MNSGPLSKERAEISALCWNDQLSAIFPRRGWANDAECRSLRVDYAPGSFGKFAFESDSPPAVVTSHCWRAVERLFPFVAARPY